MRIVPGSLRASIVIPTYNRGVLLTGTVGRFLEQLSDDDELIVIDQSDEPSHILIDMSKANQQLQYLHIEEKGLPNARNVGVQHSSGRTIIFCDDDTIPDANFIASHLRAYNDPRVGAVAGRVLLRGIPVTNAPTVGTIRKIDFHIIAKFNSLERKFVDHFQGCNFSVSRQVFLHGVKSDKRFGGTAHLEECDLALQITKKGYQIIFEPEAALLHLVQAGGGCKMPDRGKWLYWYGHNYMLLQLKHGLWLFFPTFLLARLVKLSLTALSAKDLNLLIQGIRGLIDGTRTYHRCNE